MAKISIGILAWNEEKTIAKTLRSLAEQDLVTHPNADITSIEIVVVPNGSRDDTENVARKTLEALNLSERDVRVRGIVHALAQAGKAGAWNEYVHRLSDQEATHIFLMDADVELHGKSVLSSLVRALDQDPSRAVACARPVKSIAFKERKGVADRASLSASDLQEAGPAGICGMLYCARGDVLRGIWLPPGLLVEDGFLRAMVVTGSFSHPERPERVVRVDDACVVYDAELTLRGLIRHERRLCTGTAVNIMLFDEFWSLGSQENINDRIQERNALDRKWVERFVAERVRGKLWLMPEGHLTQRIRQAKDGGRLRKNFPVVIAGTVLDALVGVLSSAELRRGRFSW